MGPQHQGADDDATQVAQDVLHGVSVRAGDADGGCPLMVDFVDPLVQCAVMQQPGGGEGEGHKLHSTQWDHVEESHTNTSLYGPQ